MRYTFLLALLLMTACSDDADPGATNPNNGSDTGADLPGDDASPDAGDDTRADARDDATPDAEPDAPEPGGLEVVTSEGVVMGQIEGDTGVRSWKGIPYAAAPTGALRWRAPAAASARAEALDASAFGPTCPQPSADEELPQDEDCLTLNIWSPSAPETPELLPVMLWIHGGSFTGGSASLPFYDGTVLATHDVVVVSINYRLGALGFMAHEALIDPDAQYPSTGNYGLLDQIAALQWVRANVAAFGGDQDRITLFGESAGAISICTLMASPLAEGLYAQAIMESGFCSSDLAYTTEARGETAPAVEQGARIAGRLGCADGDVAACLRAASVDEIRTETNRPLGQAESFNPSVDGHVLTQTPGAAQRAGETHDVPLLLGANEDEGTIFVSATTVPTEAAYARVVNGFFGADVGAQVLAQYPAADYSSPYRALADLFGDLVFVCPTRSAARHHAAAGRNTWLYHFNHELNFGAMRNIGVFHGSEIGFAFGTLGAFTLPTPDELRLSQTMQELWTSYAKGGPPAAEGVLWRAYVEAEDEGLELTLEPAMTAG